ncbi:MAG: 50S ribosomal protein L22 [Nitrospiraceae bacterium]|nr:MAG: 50S ribosomal protein L22 [Nitrospiraceae bacterium]
MESKAKLRYARISPRKVRRLTDLIKGKKAGEAMISLDMLPHRGGKIVSKILRSAMANAEQKKVADPESMKVSKVFVDQGPTMKRIMPRAMGRADVIRKRTSHITVVLEE